MFSKENKNRIISAGFAAALIILSIMVAISASKIYEYTFVSNFNTGSVDIKLTQYQITDSGEKTESSSKSVLPGEKISYIPEISNLRAKAYVRLKVEIVMERETTMPITTDNVFLVNDGWLQKGDYFYYTKPMASGEVKDAFQGIAVPKEWTNEDSSAFTVTAHAEAIQAVNFNPDFDSNTPWGSVAIEQANSYDGNDYGIAKTVAVSNEMTFSKDAGLEANTKDLFRGFQSYMAGDEYSDTLKIKNTASNPITVYFKTDNIGSDIKTKMKLKIQLKDKKIYSGDLLSTSLSSYRKLAAIEPGKSVSLDYTVTLPDDSQNAYSVLSDNVSWKFKVVEQTKAVKTGDNAMLALWLLIFLAAAVGLSALIRIARIYDLGKKEAK